MDNVKKSESVGTKAKGGLTGIWKNLKAEFKKIIWPSKETFTKQMIAVIVSSLVIGLMVALFDLVIVKLLLELVIG
ncbi:MAG: preprotein translocase subunit SecE [Lachnospiraceae bacterium]|nr:preprotein translocase subunit SecE [Lachnospiraceae bacterium]